MKRLLLLVVLAAALTAWLSVLNCSNPLDADGGGFKRITRVEYDTVLLPGDTIYETVTDTLIQIDVDSFTDTLIETVEIYIEVPGEPYTICSIIQYNLNELIWTFNNPAGTYNLLFTVAVEREFSFHELIFTIGDDIYTLKPSESLELAIECDLEENVTIDIRPDVPLLLGHHVDVCLAISEKE